MDVVMVAPFALEPKGTVKARMVPIASELRSRGYSVKIVVPPWDNTSYSGSIESLEGVPIHHVSASGDTIWDHLQITGRLIFEVDGFSPDIIHAFKPIGHSGFTIIYNGIKRKFTETPALVVDTDDWEGDGGHNKRSNRSRTVQLVKHHQERMVPHFADAITVASRTLQTQMWGIGIDPCRVFYAPNGQSECRFEMENASGNRIRDMYNLGSAPVILLYTRFFEYDLKRVVSVFSQVKENLPDVQILVVGTGRDDEEIQFKEYVMEAELQSSVHMAGWVEFSDLPDHFAAADIGIYPFDDTLINRAKCPAKLTELMLAGLPVVAEDVGQVGEYLTHGETGLLCPPNNPDQFAQEIIRILNDPDLQDRLGRDAQNQISTQFAWRAIVDNIESAYRTAVMD